MAHDEKATPKPSDTTNDVELDVAAVVLKTLKNIAGTSPIPALKQSAKLTLEITTTVQTAKGNKDNFEGLACDARELVFVISCAVQDVGREMNVPLDLMNHLDQVLNILIQVKEFAEKSSSRSLFSALMSAEGDAEQIQSYRQMLLQQCASQFGTDINLKVMVFKLVARQAKIPEPELPEERVGVERNGDTAPSPNSSPNLVSKSGSRSVSTTRSNVEQNETNSGKERTGSRVVNDASTTTVNGSAGHDKAWVKHDNSVHVGEGVSFAGAYGFNFGGSPTVTWNISKTS